MAAILIPYTLIAQGLYSGVVGAISTVTLGACSIVTSIYNHKNPDVDKIIIDLDIERKLRVIQSVLNAKEKEKIKKPDLVKMKLNNLEKSQIFEIINEKENDNDPIELCLHYIHETIQKIHENLTAINKKVAYHNTKWFSSWRTLNVKTLLKELETNTKLLDSRFKDLMKISKWLENNKKN